MVVVVGKGGKEDKERGGEMVRMRVIARQRKRERIEREMVAKQE